ncbi:hypothetical protein SB783_37400 [Paraburkholderia sp. SIMBA_009]
MSALETVTCSRCGGTGKFSYNAMDGDRCYGCHGAGKKYTKRGAVAAAYLKSLRQVHAADVKPGDSIRVAGVVGARFYRVLDVKIGRAKDQGCYSRDGEYTQVKIECDGITTFEGVESLIVKAFTKEEMRAQLEKAVAFQATLTKAGTPRKRAA